MRHRLVSGRAIGGGRARSRPRIWEHGLCAPDFLSPVLAGPELAMPAVAAPVLAGPLLATPGVAAPGVAAPGVAAPGVAAPGVAGPVLAGPELATPGVAAPVLTTPGLPGPLVSASALSGFVLSGSGLSRPGLPGLELLGAVLPVAAHPALHPPLCPPARLSVPRVALMALRPAARGAGLPLWPAMTRPCPACGQASHPPDMPRMAGTAEEPPEHRAEGNRPGDPASGGLAAQSQNPAEKRRTVMHEGGLARTSWGTMREPDHLQGGALGHRRRVAGNPLRRLNVF
jgi:hypothetical protein